MIFETQREREDKDEREAFRLTKRELDQMAATLAEAFREED